MRRSVLNFVLDGVSFLVMLAMIGTGLVMRFVLPPGTGGRGRGEEPTKLLWGLGRHDWGDVHFWLAVVLLVLLAVHVALHWTWICNLVRRLVLRTPAEDAAWSTRRNLYGAVALLVVIVLIGGFLWLAAMSAEQRPGEPEHRRAAPRGPWRPQADPAGGASRESRARGRGTDVQGWMTLRQVAASAGVPAAYVIRQLGLPEDVRQDEQLGQLRRRYGFRMDDLRRALTQYEPPSAPGP